MAFSYSGIVGYGKPSLPSVESWKTNNNIMKDPPRSIVAPRRDKVGRNSQITQEIEDSGDRIAEIILAYPRGVNPMVGVSYNGAGNAGINGGLGASAQAKLPYRVMMDGEFRPPVLAPVDLLPLSRMPRLITKINCVVNNPDFRRKLTCEAPRKTYKPHILNTSCATRPQLNIRKPSELIDRRHMHTRKQVQTAATACASSQERRARIDATGLVNLHMRDPLGAEALDRPHYQRRDTAGAGATVNHVAKHIAAPPHAEMTTPIMGPRKGDAAPATLQGQRGGPAFRAELPPCTAIPRVVDLERPAYRRAHGMGGVLAPDGGVYNVERRA